MFSHWFRGAVASGVFALVAVIPARAEEAPPAAPPAEAARAESAASEAPVDPVIERGKYLTAAGDCVSCHTRKGGEPFAGGRPFKTPLGTLYSSNITPDNDTGIGKWAEADLIRAMHEGVAAGGYKLFPAFPYTSFSKVADEDIKAIYAYMRTLAPVKYTPPSNGIVFSQRWGMMFWNAIFFKPGRFQPDTTKSDEWNRGAYLVEGLGHCGDCHSPRIGGSMLMGKVAGKEYAGQTMEDEVAEGKLRPWAAVNLTPGKGGLAAWSVDDIAKYLKKGFSPNRAGTFGPMNDVIVNSTRHLTDEDAHAMAAYLKALPPQEVPAGTMPPDVMKAGAAVYEERCKKCHMSSGRGGMFNGPPLAGSAVVQASDPATLINNIIYGPEVPEILGSFGGWETMKPFPADVLNDAEVAAVATYVRGSWDNRGGPVTARDVARQR